MSERREALMREVYGTFQDDWSWYGACRVVQQVEDAAEGPPIRDGATESMQEDGRLQASKHPEGSRMRQGKWHHGPARRMDQIDRYRGGR